MVARLCEALAIPCDIIKVSCAPGNLQDRARAARYGALAEWAGGAGLAAVMTAHHADDQAETLLMRLNRASGLSGLAGVRPCRPLEGTNILLVRPLLGWRKSELEAIVSAAGLVPVHDPSNSDPRFARARMRAWLARNDGLDVSAAAVSAGHLAEASAALEWAAHKAWRRAIADPPAWRWRDEGEPVPLLALIIAHGIAACSGRSVDPGEAARLASLIGANGQGNLGGVLVTRGGHEWRFVAEPPRRTG